jgi:hypothetical protein
VKRITWKKKKEKLLELEARLKFGQNDGHDEVLGLLTTLHRM